MNLDNHSIIFGKKWTPDDISIIFVNPDSFEEEYLVERELVWNEKLKLAKEEKFPLWNGSVVALKNIAISDDKIQFFVYHIEYKDLVMRDKLGIKRLKEIYKKQNFPPYINVQCIIEDSEGNFIFGTNKEVLIAVGGTLRTDSFLIHNFSDVHTYMQEEVIIESNVSFEDVKEFVSVGFCIKDNIATFVFRLKLNKIFKEKEMLKRGEFDGELIIKSLDFFQNFYILNQRLASIFDFLHKIY